MWKEDDMGANRNHEKIFSKSKLYNRLYLGSEVFGASEDFFRIKNLSAKKDVVKNEFMANLPGKSRFSPNIVR